MGAAAKAADSFLSERCDEAVTLMDPEARYYDPRIAQFIQPDLLDPDVRGFGINRYAYALNNPVGYQDPGGENPCAVGPVYDAGKMGNIRLRRSNSPG